MKQIPWHTGWTVAPGVLNPFEVLFQGEAKKKEVTLPQDAMIFEERDPHAPSAAQMGFYPAKSYTYEKRFFVPEEWKNCTTAVSFGGVMAKAIVSVNNDVVYTNRHGYSQFTVDLTPYLRYGEENTLQVAALNYELASRWYSGSGIYREVELLQGSLLHIKPEGVRLTTLEVDGCAVVAADIRLKNGGLDAKTVKLRCALLDGDGKEAAFCENTVSSLAGEELSSHMRLYVDSPRLWSPDAPQLYTYRVQILENGEELDRAEGAFGIRTLQVDARRGLRINGKEVKMRGACIHHDNGIIGATTLEDAEEFRMKNLKAAGFNAIRSAHHPAGKALLNVCDRLGILVMDELSDMWEEPKNTADFSLDFPDNWPKAAERMVSKDYNHPCVVLYSLGNEIPEIAKRNGRRLNRAIANTLRKLDPTRFLTGGFNGFLAMADRPEEMLAEMAQAEQAAQAQAQAQSGGSEALNAAMSKISQNRMDALSVSKGLGEAMEESTCELDIAGYNYLTARHEHEHTLHPERVIVGSETYPPEIARLWGIVKRNPHVIGDFTWTGYDYLGEAGIGIYHYCPERKEQGWFPDRIAYCGDINLNGYRRPVSYLREIAYGLRKEPFLAVERVNRYGQEDNTNDWKYADTLDSWTWTGYEGRPAVVHVFSPSQEVELFVNGKSLGKKPAGEAVGYDVVYETVYEPGELTAVSYSDGKEDGRFALRTAAEPVKLEVKASKTELSADSLSCAFLTVDLLDSQNVPNRWEQKEVIVSVEGPGVLAGFGSANPTSEGSYQATTCAVYDGRVMAAVRSTEEAGTITVRFTCPGCEPAEIALTSTKV